MRYTRLLSENKSKKDGKENKGCYLRKAEDKDIDLLFRWANESEVRKNSFSTKPIIYEEHKKWFAKEKQKGTKIYILCDGALEIGTLRLNLKGHEAVISYSIAREYRNRGYGTKLIMLAEQEACHIFLEEKQQHFMILRAQVKEENLASGEIFTKLGYEKDGIQYRKKISWENQE